MTTQTERKPFEKKELPAKKPILCRFGTMPKEGKPVVFEGKESPRISLMFRVADNKYPDVAGYPVFYRCNPWINNYNGRSTNLYKLLSEMNGEDLPDDCCQVDARDLIKEDWERFFGYYVVKMDAPEKDEAGTLKWQDIEEILNPEGIEFPVESRRLERQSEPVGLPKAKTVTPAPAQDPPPRTDARTTLTSKQQPIAEMDEYLRHNANRFKPMARTFLEAAKVERIGALPEPKRRHLANLMQIEDFCFHEDDNLSHLSQNTVNDLLQTRGKEYIEDLDPSDAALLLQTITSTIDGGVSF